MSGNSNVGNRGVYEAGDQRTSKASEVGSATRFQEGAPNSHQFNDSKDSRSLGNRAAAEKQSSDSAQESLETTLGKRDPTLPAKIHGNKPSRGAEIDAELQADDEATLKKKDN
ncbi:hypothetical protein QBC42DRAFT_282090 [Cladorrhinum samala]|uniref:Uncharacterized protein n=1 Tax=Cladorrhinum samala TaxID=585594 RepID=A0AAV9I4V1_9PEZI|nr:hypothetical protein QBC42DRAFT_282090 [Cladorrhinum samala]